MNTEMKQAIYIYKGQVMNQIHNKNRIHVSHRWALTHWDMIYNSSVYIERHSKTSGMSNFSQKTLTYTL